MKASDVLNAAQVSLKSAADGASYGLVVGSLLGYLPEIAAGFSIVWISIQIYSHFFGKDKDDK